MSKLSPLASVSATREVLEAHGLATKKALGQHFLINDGIVSRICDLAEVSADNTVLEVGPGIGTLTLALLKRAGKVLAIERDTDLPRVLADTCADYVDTFALISKDALDLEEADLEQALRSLNASVDGSKGKRIEPFALPDMFVANLPYAVAATIILDFFEKFDSLQSATVMVQSEVADRICAKPGTKSYGAYTVKLSLRAQPVGRFTVGPKNFFPPPRVDSAVVRLDRTILQDEAGEPLEEQLIEAACTMADAAFANRRKTLSNSCKSYFASLGERGEPIIDHLPEIFASAEIDPRLRGETLGRDEFLALGKALNSFFKK